MEESVEVDDEESLHAVTAEEKRLAMASSAILKFLNQKRKSAWSLMSEALVGRPLAPNRTSTP